MQDGLLPTTCMKDDAKSIVTHGGKTLQCPGVCKYSWNVGKKDVVYIISPSLLMPLLVSDTFQLLRVVTSVRFPLTKTTKEHNIVYTEYIHNT